MKNNKLILFLLISLSLIFLQGCVFNFNKSNNNPILKKEKEVDYVKELSKENNFTNECDIYKKRVNLEIIEYKERVSKVSETKEEFKLIGIFKSKSLNKCFYVLENTYTNNGKNIIDYIINNAQVEETIEIFNNVDYKFLNERIKELQK